MKDNVLKRYFNMKKEYKDPDSFDSKEYDVDFYRDYHNAIKNNGDFYEKLGIEFEFKEDAKGIQMKIGENKLQLKSDQFGFSFNGIDPNKIYPYDAYLLLFDDDELQKDDEHSPLNKVASWVKKTRVVGGSFLWPIENGDTNFNPEYNKKRGGHCYSDKKYYIQDRVDLTLYEIQEVYDFINNKKAKEEIRGNILIKYSNEGTNMFKFLKTFETFETFIIVFGFDGNFVRKVGNEWKIVNIFPYNCDDEDKTDKDGEYVYLNDKYVEKARREKKLFTINTKAEDFEKMFDVVCKLINKRRIELKRRKN